MIRKLSSTLFLAYFFALIHSRDLVAEEEKINLSSAEHFEKQIAPLIKEKCSRCHSHAAKKSKNGLMLDSRDSMLKGGDSGPAIIPGDPDKSLLIQAIRYTGELQMPPEGKLSKRDIKLLEDWIQAGAVAPASRFEGQASSAIDPGKLWSFQSVKNVAVPKIHSNWPRTAIDHFILKKLKQEKLAWVEDAKPSVLCRRIYIDLVGLPPTLKQQDEFISAYSENPQKAIDQTVTKLLQTNQFGERWARHWLDTARYAESNGNNRNRVLRYAWRYRNWVIDSLNADLPYDQFLKAQIAGDLLPYQNRKQRNRQRIATGFLAVGSKPYYPTIVPFDPNEPDRARFDWAAEQIDATFKGMMGLTVGCARCHDHKSDPIPTKDYYALMGIFRSTNPKFGMYWDLFGVDEGQAQRDFLFDFNLLVLNDEILPVIKPLQDQYKPLVIEQNRINLRKRHWPQQVERMQKKLKDNKNLSEQQVTQIQAHIETRLKKLAEDKERLKVVLKLKKQLQDSFNYAVDHAMGVEDSPNPSDVHIRLAGEHAKKSDLVKRGFLTKIEFKDESSLINQKQSGRLELAHWIAHPKNPLTARVAVNRIWHHLFGRGIVESLDNFGVAGELPTHPELLDHLSYKFIHDFNWSQKKMIRYLMTSRVYQLSSSENLTTKNHLDRDPDAKLYWRRNPRRLEAEALRDSMLAVSGLLDPRRPVGSPVVDFEYYADIRHTDRQRAFDLLKGNYRTIYVPTLRGHRNKLYELFNYPDDEAVNSARSSGSVPTQALYLLNNPLIMNFAKNLAERLINQQPDDPAQRVLQLYRLCYNRLPVEQELKEDLKFIEKQSQIGNEMQAWSLLSHSFLISGEFLYRF